MKAFALKNVKSFQETGWIEFKPITVFVGPNSSGKSSLVRFPVVLSQTIKEDVSTPLLLYGNQVDYGDFEEVVHGHEKNSSVEFTIKLDGEKLADFMDDQVRQNFALNQSEVKISLTVVKADSLRIKKFSICRDPNDPILEMELGANDFYHLKFINNEQLDQIQRSRKTIFESKFSFNKFLPALDKYSMDLLQKIREYLIFEDKNENETISSTIFLGMVFNKVDLKKFVTFTSNEAISEKIYEAAKLLDNLSEEQFVEFKIFSTVYFSTLNFFAILSVCEDYLSNYLHQIVYIGPFRKEPERTYRFSENKILNVGKKGENSILLLGQDIRQKHGLTKKVSEWFESTMGCRLEVVPVDGSLFKIQIQRINESENKGESLIDVGYGVAQVLPIVTQLYFDSEEVNDEYRNRFTYIPNKTYIIEQPELHLHPAVQSSLADLFVQKVVDDPTSKIVIETHSEHLIRKLQVLVADPEVNITPDDVAIYYIDKDASGVSSVTRMNMNSKGQFEEKWPSGFFDKSYELTKELMRVASKPQSK